MRSNRSYLAGSLAAGLILTAAVGVAIAADVAAPDATAPAAPGAQGGWHHGHHGGGMLLSQLNLTPEQKAQVMTIMANARPQMKSIFQEMRANSHKLQAAQPSDANYAAVVAQVSQANGSLHSQMITQREAVRAQIYKILTPAQQTQLAALQAQRVSR